MDTHQLITRLYSAFNAREIETVLALLSPDVQWANGMEGGFVHGPEAVRAYWTRQFQVISAQVTPQNIELGADGRWVVTVHQVVHDVTGTLLQDTILRHLFTFEDGVITLFEIGE